ncbi:hypothetical protein EYZ11_012508 [Aspergillus tanneri]|uniref:Uncharacterized protein n=1 Tax=Aspergillus tanneri TaxID=1220188 RepID=A0A4V6RQM5_9EURO|nr:hypothetical protein EYZ11_012508 [Aspergillus tanneri]
MTPHLVLRVLPLTLCSEILPTEKLRYRVYGQPPSRPYA